MSLPRRTILSAPFLALSAKSAPAVAGTFVNTPDLGHRLRDRTSFPAPKRTVRIPLVIVGGGIAGLSAAWRLHKRGFRDFVLLEMEPEIGGNSRSGENEITRYPWAAHYLPVPAKNQQLVRELCTDLGLLSADGVWDERRLCFSPQERLFLHGRWQEGIEPEIAATRRDHDEYRRFQNTVRELAQTGQFTIPMESGSRSSPLDSESMKSWLERNSFNSAYLRWHIDYACRDDYGSTLNDTSAWAAFHYFAARDPEDKGPLTWPEGNAWIVHQLRSTLAPYIRTNAPVHSISKTLRVRAADTEYVAGAVIYGAPTFTAHYIVEDAPRAEFVYSPWLTANLTLHRLPAAAPVEMAWDNVLYDSPALGYVNATHMLLQSKVERTVWTYYWALAHASPAQSRKELLERDWNYWKEAILRDLERAHPDIRQCVSRIDIMRMAHAMARPVPGFLSSPDRLRWASSKGPIYYANSDLSGFSIFEEAQHRGVKAADAALRRLGSRS